MLITKRSYKKKYVIGGARIFSSIANFFARMFTSNAAKQLASTALQAGKTAAKDIGMKAIDVDKTVISKYVDTSAINLNKLIDGSSIKRENASNAIAIQDLVRRINGSGLKVT